VGSWHIDDRYRLNDSRWICSSFRRDFIISQASCHLEAAAWNTLKRPDLRRASGQRNASRNSRKRRDRYWVNSARIHPRSSSSARRAPRSSQTKSSRRFPRLTGEGTERRRRRWRPMTPRRTHGRATIGGEERPRSDVGTGGIVGPCGPAALRLALQIRPLSCLSMFGLGPLWPAGPQAPLQSPAVGSAPGRVMLDGLPESLRSFDARLK
jgi:hypothetical protein